MKENEERCGGRRRYLHDRKDDDGEFYRLGVVDSVKPVEDGRIRTARVCYMNPGSHPHT